MSDGDSQNRNQQHKRQVLSQETSSQSSNIADAIVLKDGEANRSEVVADERHFRRLIDREAKHGRHEATSVTTESDLVNKVVDRSFRDLVCCRPM
jgi:hypothetical protein